MKKLILGLSFFAIAATTTFMACKKDQQSSKDKNTERISDCPQTYTSLADSIGLHHTLGLEATYNHLSNEFANGSLDSSKYYDVANSIKVGLTSFYSSISIKGLPINLDTANSYTSYGVNSGLTNFYFTFDSTRSDVRLWTAESDAFIPEGIKPYLQTISLIVMDSSKTTLQKTIDLDNYKSTVECSNLLDQEKFVLLSALSVGISSLNYWDNNIDSWAIKFGNPFPTNGSYLKTTDQKNLVMLVQLTELPQWILLAV